MTSDPNRKLLSHGRQDGRPVSPQHLIQSSELVLIRFLAAPRRIPSVPAFPNGLKDMLRDGMDVHIPSSPDMQRGMHKLSEIVPSEQVSDVRFFQTQLPVHLDGVALRQTVRPRLLLGAPRGIQMPHHAELYTTLLPRFMQAGTHSAMFDPRSHRFNRPIEDHYP